MGVDWTGSTLNLKLLVEQERSLCSVFLVEDQGISQTGIWKDKNLRRKTRVLITTEIAAINKTSFGI